MMVFNFYLQSSTKKKSAKFLIYKNILSKIPRGQTANKGGQKCGPRITSPKLKASFYLKILESRAQFLYRK